MGQLRFYGGVITGGTYAGIYNNSSGTINVNDGVIVGETIGIYNNVDGEIIVTQGDITGGTRGLWNAGTGTITVSRRNNNRKNLCRYCQ